MIRRKNLPQITIRICLGLFFLFVVICPIIATFLRITPSSFKRLVSSTDFLPAIVNSVTTGLLATLAYFFDIMVPGLPVYSSWRKPCEPRTLIS